MNLPDVTIESRVLLLFCTIDHLIPFRLCTVIDCICIDRRFRRIETATRLHIEFEYITIVEKYYKTILIIVIIFYLS